MDYRRYGVGYYGRNLWVECTECAGPQSTTGYAETDKHLIFQWRSGGGFNFAAMIGAVMQHEIDRHPNKPLKR